MDQQGTSKMIRELRAGLALTQEQFAAKIGVTYSTINRWENDKGKPSPLAMRGIKKLQNKLKRNRPSK
ncbi:helix-turn-helix domain-containing protein [Planctomycetota bacterium]